MLSSNQISGFFDHQHHWKQCINIFAFLHGHIHQEKVACEASTFGWECLGMLNRAQTCLDFPGGPLGSFRGICRLKVIQN